MIVLSLFDGISCGMLALQRAGISIDKYYASEVDKNALAISHGNYPQIIQLGDINNWAQWNIKWEKIDLLIGGSPCQGFSFAGKQLNFNDPRSKLFFEYVTILNYIKTQNPDVKFLLENVRMKKEYENIISNCLLVEPVEINSRLVSAQDRKRLYWANFPISQPEDKHISASDIIGTDCYVGAMRGRRLDERGVRADYRMDIPVVQQIECRKDDKFNCITTVPKDNVVVFSKECFFPALENREKWRYLTVEEMEQLQTLPCGYTDYAPKTARMRAIGNGWTVDVITHIFKDMIHAFERED